MFNQYPAPGKKKGFIHWILEMLFPFFLDMEGIRGMVNYQNSSCKFCSLNIFLENKRSIQRCFQDLLKKVPLKHRQRIKLIIFLFPWHMRRDFGSQTESVIKAQGINSAVACLPPDNCRSAVG